MSDAHVFMNAQTSERLESLIAYKPSGKFEYSTLAMNEIVKELKPDGGYVNRSWIVARAAEELYARGDLDGEDYMKIQEVLG